LFGGEIINVGITTPKPAGQASSTTFEKFDFGCSVMTEPSIPESVVPAVDPAE